MKSLEVSDWIKIIRPGSRVFLGGGASVPFTLVNSMLSVAQSFKDIEIVHIHGLGETPWIDPAYANVLRTNSFFLTQDVRRAVESGQADYTPCPMSEVPGLFTSGAMSIDVALVHVTPPDESGRVSLGVSVDVVKAAVKSAKVVVAQINPRMPWIGGKALIPVKKIDYFLKVSSPLPVTAPSEFDDRHERIGRYAAQLIEDGSTIQVGLGNSPEAVVRALRKHKHLGIHSGMLNDALMDLVRCGAVDHSRKTFRPGKMIASHIVGSQKLYRFAANNPDIELHPSDWVNDPFVVARNARMVAINGAREIDLTGQVVRDSRGHRFYGGIGAMQDFIRGAGRSKDGRPVIVLTSTTDQGQRSRIVAGLAPGAGVVTSRGDVHYVVTEYGVASLHGRSIRERVARLVEIAHPNHRESLLEGAHDRGWLPKFFTMPAASPSKSGVDTSIVQLGGEKFRFRPLYPSDMRLLQEFFYSHDEETVRLRYGYQRERMTGESAYKLVAIDQTKDMALGIFVEQNEREAFRAVGRFSCDADPTTAEVAFVVHEDTRRHGMASFLLGELARIARKRGVKEFHAQVLRENKPMAGLFLRFGATETTHFDDEEREFRMNVSTVLRRSKEVWAAKGIEWGIQER